jgi:hypothetical protein
MGAARQVEVKARHPASKTRVLVNHVDEPGMVWYLLCRMVDPYLQAVSHAAVNCSGFDDEVQPVAERAMGRSGLPASLQSVACVSAILAGLPVSVL